MIFRNKRDSESWIRELTIDTMKENIYIAENDVIEISSGNFYKAVKTSTDIPLKNDLFAQLIPSELVGNVTTALKLKEPRKIELSGDVTGNVEFDGSKNVNLVANITDDSHSHSDSTITSLDAKKIKTGVIDEKRIPNLNANKISEGVFSEERIPVLDASKIGSGIIDIARLPAAALERLVEVEDDNARFKLTKTQIQLGDVVKVKTTLKMYKVINDDSLNNEKGYSVFLAGRAAEVPWSGVTDKPETFTPSKHGHSFSEIKLDNEHEFVSKTEKANWNSKAEKQHSHSFSELKLDDEHGFVSKAERNTWNSKAEKQHNHLLSDIKLDDEHKFVSNTEKNAWNSKAEKQHKHEKSEITDFPVSLKNPFPLQIKINGKELAVYNGESEKSVNIITSDIDTYPKIELDKKFNEKANTSHGNHVPEVQEKSDKTFLRNDNTWAVVTPENIGAQPKGDYAPKDHKHNASEISVDDNHLFTTKEEKEKLNKLSSNISFCKVTFVAGKDITFSNGKATVEMEMDKFSVIKDFPEINSDKKGIFYGWDIKPSDAVINGKIQKDAVITALYQEPFKTVTFICSEGGSFYDGSKQIVDLVNVGEKVVTPKIKVNKYRAFSNWEPAITPDTKVDKDITYTAKFKPLNANIEVNDGARLYLKIVEKSKDFVPIDFSNVINYSLDPIVIG